jgi:hypothetical protein
MRFSATLLVLAAACVACGDDDDSGDAGGTRDATTGNPDGGTTSDSGTVADSGTTPPDSGVVPDSGTMLGECPIDPAGRMLIENIVNGLVLETGLVAYHARPREAAFVIAVPGTGFVSQNYAFLVDECRGPMTFDPYCVGGGISPGGGGGEEPGDFFNGRDLCTRLGCEADDVYLYEMWLVMVPHTESDDLHAFTYDTMQPVGTAVSDPNPHLTWRVVTSTPTASSVSATVSVALDVTPQGSQTIDADFEARLSGMRVSNETDTEHFIDVSIDVDFPRIAGTTPVTLQTTFAQDDTVSGDVRHGGDVLGTMVVDQVTEAHPIRIEWTSACR